MPVRRRNVVRNITSVHEFSETIPPFNLYICISLVSSVSHVPLRPNHIVQVCASFAGPKAGLRVYLLFCLPLCSCWCQRRANHQPDPPPLALQAPLIHPSTRRRPYPN